MTTLRVHIDNRYNAKAIATLLRTLECVKSVTVETTEITLSNTDWILPGRTATEAEINQLLDDMDKDDDEGYTTEQMIAQLSEWKNKPNFKELLAKLRVNSDSAPSLDELTE
jgi:Ca2+-binding EF-hand superfamily protein